MTTSEPRSKGHTRLAADIRALAAIERPSASPGEEAAARWVRSRLRETGLQAEIEEFQFNPAIGAVWGLHSLAALLSAALGLGVGRAPRLGAVLAAFTAASFWGDATTEFHLMRRLLPKRPSYNVLARIPNPGARRIVIISAHHDASHSGLVFHPWMLEQATRIRGEASPPPLEIPLLSMIAISAAAALRGIGLRHRILRRSLVFGALLNAALFALMQDVSRSPVSPCANDDASGVAVLLALAEQFTIQPPADLELWFLSTGSEEGMLGGMSAFIERHGTELEGRRPFVLNLEMAGSGRPVYLESEGFLRRHSYHQEAVELARAVSAEDEFEGVGSVAVAPFVSDALIATRHGIPAITIASLNAAGYVPNYHWASDTPDNVDLRSVENTYAFCQRLLTRLAERQ